MTLAVGVLYILFVKLRKFPSFPVFWEFLSWIGTGFCQMLYLCQIIFCCLVAKLCPALFDPVDCDPPGSSVHGTSEARRLEWIAISFSRASSPPKALLHWQAGSLPLRHQRTVKVAQLCPTLCNPMDYRVHGILQSRRLEWVAFLFSRGSPQPRNWTGLSHIAGGFLTS